MKKTVTCVQNITFFVFCVDWAVLGIKMFLIGNGSVIVEICIAIVCAVIMSVCLWIKKISSKCPHCGKISDSGGEFCPHCGKTIK